MRRARLVDLFCHGGGAAVGYHAAGFDVTGVDIAPQPHYPFTFIQADVFDLDPAFLLGFDVLHASPPCQAYSAATPTARRADHADLIAPVRDLLTAAVAEPGGPWAYVIENVPGAPLHRPVTICGDSLRLGVRRHRLFESNLPLYGTACWHDRPAPPVPVYGTYGQRAGRQPDHDQDPRPAHTTDQARAAMGIDWLPWPALTQAIPPTYTHWLGVQLHAHRPTPPAGHDSDVTPELWDSVTQTGGDANPSTSTGFRHHQSAVTEPAGGFRHRRCHCGSPLTRPAAGRWPRHCSHACRQAAYRTRQRTNPGATP